MQGTIKISAMSHPDWPWMVSLETEHGCVTRAYLKAEQFSDVMRGCPVAVVIEQREHVGREDK